MAPRKKKPRLSSHPASTPSNVQPTPTPTPSPSKADETSPSKSDFDFGPWTDEQETALFKGMIQWKPVGMHKHFRMLSISNYLNTYGHTHSSLAPYTRIPGIWSKLGQLYDLETLDEREDSFPLTPNSGDSPPVDPITEQPFTEFTLPFSDYGPTILQRALAVDGEKQETGDIRAQRPHSKRRGTRQTTIDDSTVGEDHDIKLPEPAHEPITSKGTRSSRSATKHDASGPPAGKAELLVDDKASTRRSGRKR